MNNKFNKQLIFQIDAFTSELLQGNPAAVCPLDNWLDDRLMQLIARENNLSETAFIVKNKNNGNYQIRWFTPSTEVDLCGHATLASAFVLFEILGYKENKINFESKSGELIVHKKDNLLQMDFPALPFTSIKPSLELIKAIKIVPDEVYQSKFDIL